MLVIRIKKSILKKVSFHLAKFIYNCAVTGGKLSGKLKWTNIPRKFW